MRRLSPSLEFIKCSCNSSPFILSLIRRFAAWSMTMKKDPDLELALTRNLRWIANNNIKNLILKYPNQVTPVRFIQRNFKTLDMRGVALKWLEKYPSCFEVFHENGVQYCRLTKRIMAIVEEEELVKEAQEPVFVERLAKILMMTTNRRLNIVKLNQLRHNFGFPDDYLIRIVPKYPQMFRLVNHCGKKTSLEVELISWNSDLAISQIEESAAKQNTKPCFSCSLPLSWVNTRERLDDINSTPYISPYIGSYGLGLRENDKRAIALMHELLSLSLWKKISIMKLARLKKEFALPGKISALLLKHPCIFYVSNKYSIHTAVLREAYSGSNLIHKDPLVVIKDKFDDLMQEGRHEYTQRRRLLNLEKRKKMGINLPKVVNEKDENARMSRLSKKNVEISAKENRAGRVGRFFDPVERERFYKLLFDKDS